MTIQKYATNQIYILRYGDVNEQHELLRRIHLRFHILNVVPIIIRSYIFNRNNNIFSKGENSPWKRTKL